MKMLSVRPCPSCGDFKRIKLYRKHFAVKRYGINCLRCGYCSKTDLWATPQDFFDVLDGEYHFDLDVCALPENTKCAEYFTPEVDGLAQD